MVMILYKIFAFLIKSLNNIWMYVIISSKETTSSKNEASSTDSYRFVSCINR